MERVGDKWNLIDKQGEIVNIAEIVIVASGVGVDTIKALAWMPVSAVRGQMTEIHATEKSARINDGTC